MVKLFRLSFYEAEPEFAGVAHFRMLTDDIVLSAHGPDIVQRIAENLDCASHTVLSETAKFNRLMSSGRQSNAFKRRSICVDVAMVPMSFATKKSNNLFTFLASSFEPDRECIKAGGEVKRVGQIRCG